VEAELGSQQPPVAESQRQKNRPANTALPPPKQGPPAKR
jgi:hypothetical protein